MGNVSVVAENHPKVRLRVRSQTCGPERDYMNAFIKDYSANIKARNLKSDTVLYIEPRIDSGYPDIVSVRYNDAAMDNWVPERLALDDDDLRILSHLIYTNGADIDDLVSELGFSLRKASRSIELLNDCHLVERKSHQWKSVKRASFLSVNNITAIEVKLSDARSVRAQAVRNTRFSSCSYALLNIERPSQTLADSFSKAGIGLLVGSSYSEIVKPCRHPLPIGYVALRFNEWVCSLLALGEIR